MTSGKKGGTGLGLPFCRRVMKAFGGDISCKSVAGEGVEFCLKF
jgi:signal transduction histidine kinase